MNTTAVLVALLALLLLVSVVKWDVIESFTDGTPTSCYQCVPCSTASSAPAAAGPTSSPTVATTVAPPANVKRCDLQFVGPGTADLKNISSDPRVMSTVRQNQPASMTISLSNMSSIQTLPQAEANLDPVIKMPQTLVSCSRTAFGISRR